MFKEITLDGKESPQGDYLNAEGLDMNNIPRHIAIIMDGNGRWARKRGQVRTYGHQAGAETLKTIVKAAAQLGVEVISAYAFSTENWKRPKTEISFLMGLISHYLSSGIEELHENNVRLRFMGLSDGMPGEIVKKMKEAEEHTAHNTGIILNLAVNYGGRSELLEAMRSIYTEIAAGKLDIGSIDESIVDAHLFTSGLPPLDLLIRPGGDMRVSNFMLWQLAYTEIWTTGVFWPDFTPVLLIEAIRAYQGRERRYGGLVSG